MIFGFHTPDQIGNIRKITEGIPRVGGKSLFIAELGGIYDTEFMVANHGTKAEANARECVATGQVNDQFRQDVSRFLDKYAEKRIWKEIARREAGKNHPRKTSKKKRKQKKGAKLKPISTTALENIAKEKTFQLGLLLMAKQKGFEVATEIPSAEAVLNSWISSGHEQDFLFYWANAEPSKFNFRVLLGCAKKFYSYLQLHQLDRDRSFSERLISEASRYECVVVQWGIAHRGFYQREMSGINFYSHSEPEFTERLLHDGVMAEDLSEPQQVIIIKDILSRFLINYSSLSPAEAVGLSNKLPQDMTSLEGFFSFYNSEFRRLLDPRSVVTNIIASLSFG